MSSSRYRDIKTSLIGDFPLVVGKHSPIDNPHSSLGRGDGFGKGGVENSLYNPSRREFLTRPLPEGHRSSSQRVESLPRVESQTSVSKRDFEIFEACTNSSGKPRLSKAREYFSNLLRDDIPLLKDVFSYWQQFSEFLVVKGENLLTGEIIYTAVKCSKRGNDVYSRRLNDRLGFIKKDDIQFFGSSEFDDYGLPLDRKGVKTRLLWVTLTFDTKHRFCLNDGVKGKLCEVGGDYKIVKIGYDEAWLGRKVIKVKKSGKNKGDEYWTHSNNCRCIRCQFNLWITNLRNKYGKIAYLSFLQAYPNSERPNYGYPHLHLLMLFSEAEFNVFQKWEYDKRKKAWGFVYRVQEKDEIHDAGGWYSFSDIKAIHSLSGAYSYCKKHMSNANSGSSSEAVLNNSMLWLYHKNTFSMSGDFREKLSEYVESISNMRNSKPFQCRLDGSKPFKVWKFTLMGREIRIRGKIVKIITFSLYELIGVKEELSVYEDGIDVPWVISLNPSEVDKLLS